jgi:hypothetical protein
MAQRWRVGISGKQRKDVDVTLLIQAVIALGHQLREEAERTRSTGSDGEIKKDEGGEVS